MEIFFLIVIKKYSSIYAREKMYTHITIESSNIIKRRITSISGWMGGKGGDETT